MDKNLPDRKRLRLKNYDYSSNGAYFITICTKNRTTLFSIVGADPISALPASSLSSAVVENAFLETVARYDGVEAPVYVLMPNHFHAIITFSRADKESAPTSLSAFVRDFKRHSTSAYADLVKQGRLPPFDGQLWQRSYYDHIIRNRDDYLAIAKYIHENPSNWSSDELYCDE